MPNKKISDEQFFSLLEGELSKKEETRLLTLIASNKDLSEEWEMWQLTVQEDEAVVFANKDSLLAITDTKDKKAILLWAKWAAAAAVLLFVFISVWMLKDTHPTIENELVNSTTKSSIQTQPKELNHLNEKVLKEEELLVEDKLISKISNSQTEQLPIVKRIAKVNEQLPEVPLLDADSIIKPKRKAQVAFEDIDTMTKPIPSQVAVASPEIEVVHGTKVSKKKLRLRKLLALRTKAKEEVNEWIEKPQFNLVKENNNKSALNVGNKKYKLNLKISNYE